MDREAGIALAVSRHESPVSFRVSVENLGDEGRVGPIRHRGTDSATDVPSFSYDDQTFLGDIVITRGVAKRQAREAGHSEATEIRVLALHGLLHLLGYDHERDAGRMRRVEERLMVEYHRADEMRCPMHFCVGQESAPAVLSLLVRQRDEESVDPLCSVIAGIDSLWRDCSLVESLAAWGDRRLVPALIACGSRNTSPFR